MSDKSYTFVETERELPYTHGTGTLTKVELNSEIAERVESFAKEYERGRTQYDAEAGLKRRLRNALKGESGTAFDGRPHALVGPLYVVSVASIQTPTPIWETATEQWLDGEIGLETYLNRTENGRTKFDCVRRTLDTDLIDKAESELRRNHITSAVHYLTGGDDDVSTYLRGVKAYMVVRWFFDVPCIDTNVHKAIQPIIAGGMDTAPRYHRNMDPGRKKQARERTADGDGRYGPDTKTWMQERVGRYGELREMKAIWDIAHGVIADMTDIPEDAIAQVAFNLGGQTNNDTWERTTHVRIYEAIGRNIEQFAE